MQRRQLKPERFPSAPPSPWGGGGGEDGNRTEDTQFTKLILTKDLPRPMTSHRCRVCRRDSPLTSNSLGVCLSCIRDNYEECELLIAEAHARVRRNFGLPAFPPRTAGGVPCALCANECVISDGDRGYCGLRAKSIGAFTSVTSPNKAALYYYLDPQVTNCCAAWFCPAGTGAGYPKYACRPGP